MLACRIAIPRTRAADRRSCVAVMTTIGMLATRWDHTEKIGARASGRMFAMWFGIIAGIFVLLLVVGAWLWDRSHGTSGTRIEIADRRPDSDRPGVG